MFVLCILAIVEMFPYEYDFSESLNGENVLIEGRISQKEIKTNKGQISYCIYLEQIKSLSVSDADDIGDKTSKIQQLNNVSGILCYLKEDSVIPKIGSKVQLQGEISAFEIPDNPGEFDGPLYYKIKGVDLKMYDCNIVAYGNDYAFLKEGLFSLKVRLCQIIDKCFKEHYQGIAKAIFLGMSGQMEEETKELYQRCGMLHILCVSGLHITILGMGLFKVLKKLKVPEWFCAVVCIFFMLMYGVMLGMGTSVLRAILMFSLKLIAKMLKRTYDLLTASCVGVFLILFEQPLYVYHSGFLFSFLSVIGLGAFRQLFPDKICKFDFLNQRADNFFSTLTVWIVTLPVYGRFYYEVSVSGLLLNVMLLPFVSVVLILVIGVCMLGGISIPMGIMLAKGCEIFLYVFEAIFEFFDSVSKTNIVTGYMSLGKCIIYYLLLTFLLFSYEKIKKKYTYFILLVLCLSVFISFSKKLTITCLSVGQGDAAVIEYMDFVALIDAGSSSKKEIAKYSVLPFLKYRGIQCIDYLFLTHADADHINGVKEILNQSKRGIMVKRLVVTDTAYGENYDGILELAEKMQVKVYEMKQGDMVEYNTLKLECLAPNEKHIEAVRESTNETSMVLLLQKNEFSMLFTGDTEGEGERSVTENLKKENINGITVLKVSHHGSKNSTKEEFLKIANPKVAIISCGKNNSYGHPHMETLEKLKQINSLIFITKDVGAVRIEVGKQVKVYSHLSPKGG